MTTEGPARASWWSRNQWPLVVGVVALVALLGWTLLAIDRFSDDEDNFEQQVTERSGHAESGADRFRFDNGAFDSNGILLGVSFDEFDELVVAAVMPGSPADETGLRHGDVILEVDGQRVRDVEELWAAIWVVPAGHEYELTIERDDGELTLEVRRVELFAVDGPNGRRLIPDVPPGFGGGPGFDGRRPDAQPGLPDEFELQRLRPTLGVSVVQISEGLQVMTVLPGSAAAEAGFREGDVITKIGRQPVQTIDQLRDALPSFELSDGEPPDEIGDAVEITVLRGDRELELEVVFSIRPGGLLPLEPPGTAQEVPAIPEEMLGQLLEQLLMRLLADLEGDATSDLGQRVVDEVLTRLFADLEGDATSDLGQRVVDDVLTRLFADLEGDATSDLGQRVVDEVLMRLFADLEADGAGFAAQLSNSTVYSGSVAELGDASIVLTGVRGPIRLTITNTTVFVGASPRVGGVASVAADADANAVLVVVAD